MTIEGEREKIGKIILINVKGSGIGSTNTLNVTYVLVHAHSYYSAILEPHLFGQHLIEWKSQTNTMYIFIVGAQTMQMNLIYTIVNKIGNGLLFSPLVNYNSSNILHTAQC